jgi:hypothetical protein
MAHVLLLQVVLENAHVHLCIRLGSTCPIASYESSSQLNTSPGRSGRQLWVAILAKVSACFGLSIVHMDMLMQNAHKSAGAHAHGRAQQAGRVDFLLLFSP